MSIATDLSGKRQNAGEVIYAGLDDLVSLLLWLDFTDDSAFSGLLEDTADHLQSWNSDPVFHSYCAFFLERCRDWQIVEDLKCQAEEFELIWRDGGNL